MEKLQKLRSDIDIIDNEIFDLLNERFNIIKKISIFKKKNNILLLDINRENNIINNIINNSRDNIDEIFVKNIFKIIFSKSLNIQKQIIKKNIL